MPRNLSHRKHVWFAGVTHRVSAGIQVLVSAGINFSTEVEGREEDPHDDAGARAFLGS